MTDTTAIEQREAGLPEERENAVVIALLSGRSIASVRAEFSLTIDQIDAIILRTWPLDSRARVRMIARDLGLLDKLISEFYKRALLTHDATSAAFATVAIKAQERKASLCGLDAVRQVDLQIIQPKQVKSHEKLRSVVYSLVGRQPPPALEEPAADQPEPPVSDGNGHASEPK